jgi:predicted metal-dependent peptidase
MLSIGKPLTAGQRLHKATTDIIGQEEFVGLSGVLMIGKREIVEDCPTAATNGRDEIYGRAFVESLSDAEFRFLILHENYHKMYRHLSTWKHLWDKDKKRANQACDYVINLKLVDTKAGSRGWIKMPECGLLDRQYAGMDAQQVFNLLPENDGEGGEGGEGGGMDGHDWEGAQDMSASEAEALAREVDEAIRQGAILAAKTGSGGLRDLGELLQTSRDWRELLRDFITTTCAGKDYSTWRKPNRKYIGMDMLMPSSISETVEEIVIAIDTSGSIGGEFLTSFLSEVTGICDQIKPSKIRLLYWDTKVCRSEVYLQDGLDNVVKSTKPEGGGGTNVQCVPMYLNEHNIKPECVVVLTDGYVGSWGVWSTPVLWCIKGNKSAKPDNGVVVHI